MIEQRMKADGTMVPTAAAETPVEGVKAALKSVPFAP